MPMPLEFKTIDLSAQEDYREVLFQCPQVTSDYSFINLWGWANVYGLEWAWAENLVWIRQNLPETIYWAPMGDWKKADWQKIFDIHMGLSAEINRVPEMLTEIWKDAFDQRMTAVEDRDQWDYIYDAKDLINLPGNRFHKKKNHVNQFKKSYVYKYKPMESDVVKQAMGLQDDWCEWRDCNSDVQLAHENQAIERVMSEWGNLIGIAGGCLFVDGRLVAYTVGEKLTPEMTVIHFEKANAEYKGAYQAINQIFLEQQASDDDKWVNREQDIGDEGLRKAKLSYHPTRFLKKYRVSFKPQ